MPEVNELEECREDVRERGIGSRVVLLVASAGRGRSAILAGFELRSTRRTIR
jgi:hypothetical protein